MGTPLDLERTTGLVSEGMHLFRIESGEEKASTSSGQPMWVLGLVCQDAGEDQGKKMSLFLSLTAAARFKIDQLLDAIEAPKHGTWTVEQCVNKSLKVYIVHEEYNGAPTMKAWRMLPANSTAVVTPPPSSTSAENPQAPELSQAVKTPFGIKH